MQSYITQKSHTHAARRPCRLLLKTIKSSSPTFTWISQASQSTSSCSPWIDSSLRRLAKTVCVSQELSNACKARPCPAILMLWPVRPDTCFVQCGTWLHFLQCSRVRHSVPHALCHQCYSSRFFDILFLCSSQLLVPHGFRFQILSFPPYFCCLDWSM